MPCLARLLGGVVRPAGRKIVRVKVTMRSRQGNRGNQCLQWVVGLAELPWLLGHKLDGRSTASASGNTTFSYEVVGATPPSSFEPPVVPAGHPQRADHAEG